MMARPRLKTAFRLFLLLTAAAMVFCGAWAQAQFTLTSLVTTTKDSHLKNAWGMAYVPGGPFWISDEDTGVSTIYDANGTIASLIVTVPSATTGKGTPTGIVENSTSGFVVTQNGKSGAAAFIFDTLDGTISGWSPNVDAHAAVIAVDNHATANYTGLAIGKSGTQTFLFAANSATNQIEVYNSTFKLVTKFTDTKLSGLKVYGVSVLKNQVYVTFSGSTTGAVDIFTTTGKFVKTIIAPTSTLRGPWGLAIAPISFDTLSGSLLVGNVDDGKIHGFNLTTGKLIGTIKDKTGKVISIPGLWALLFGGGTTTNGKANQLFFAAGTGGYATGEFGVITP